MNWCEEHDHFKRTCPWCEIEQMRAELNRQWISVKDRLPDHDCKVLVVDVTGDQEIVPYENGCLDVDGEVTHWMPLPEPPKGDDDE